MSEYTENNIDRALDWDDEISVENEYILLPAGEYDFTVTGFDREQYDGGDKIPPCKKAVIYINIQAPQGGVTLKESLLLHSKMEWKLSEFFIAIGQKKKGESLRPRWQEVVGARGRCKLEIHKWQGRNGEPMESNRVTKYLEPQKSSVPAAGYTPGQF